MDYESTKLKKRGKSFFWASLFFSKRERKDIEKLYSFCRYIDDIGDNGKFKKEKAKKLLESIKKDILKNSSKKKIIFDFLDISRKYNINTKIPLTLIEGVILDLKTVNLKKISELIDYSFKVAGTVGLMMCSLMKIYDKELYKHAIELGIAMQITNIARDVKEDLEVNRIYLPSTIRGISVLNCSEIINSKNAQNKISNNMNKLIQCSEILYDQATKGIMLLPIKFKFIILLAANLYREIGRQILKEPRIIWSKRVFVTKKRKIFIFFQTIFFMFNRYKRKETRKIKVGYLLKQLNIE